MKILDTAFRQYDAQGLLQLAPIEINPVHEGEPGAILNHNRPTAYLIPAETYEQLLEKLDGSIQSQFKKKLKERLQEPHIKASQLQNSFFVIPAKTGKRSLMFTKRSLMFTKRSLMFIKRSLMFIIQSLQSFLGPGFMNMKPRFRRGDGLA